METIKQARFFESLASLGLDPKTEAICKERLIKGGETYGKYNFLEVDLFKEMAEEIYDVYNYIVLMEIKGDLGFADKESLLQATKNLQKILDKVKRGDDYDREDNYEFL